MMILLPLGGIADKSSEESRIMIGSGDVIVLLLFSEEFSPSLDDDEFCDLVTTVYT